MATKKEIEVAQKQAIEQALGEAQSHSDVQIARALALSTLCEKCKKNPSGYDTKIGRRCGHCLAEDQAEE